MERSRGLNVLVDRFFYTLEYFVCLVCLVTIFVCFVLGLTNAGTRVLRITYLFNNIPNNLIGRTGSVFQTTNVFIRFAFITLFSLTFFSKENNITWAYFICGLFIFISIFPLLIYYKKLVNLKSDE